jgi:DNA helicase-2/ATP-dependent DNA helicase PcrA
MLHGRVCVVGDDAQSIYSFRGAKIENILSFRKDYPEAQTFKLEQNYRSTKTIVNAANSVIEHNSRRMEKVCFSEGEGGEKIKILRSTSDREEGEIIATALRERMRQTGDGWNEVVILYRNNSQSAIMEQALRRRGIPYRIYKGSSFYDHKEIKSMLAYMRLVINPKDDEAFKRVVNYPTRGIGDTTVLRIAQLAEQRAVSMWEAVDALVSEAQTLGDPMQKSIARKVTEFVNLIRSLQQERQTKGLYDFGLAVASRTGMLALFREENTPEAQSAIDNIEELLNTMQLFKEQREAEIRNGEREESEQPTVDEWLQNIMLLTDMDNEEEGEGEKVTLMTVHSSKGLEYKYVYIVGCEENLFPSQRALESMDGLEEERRLFYVALTRAKQEATLSYSEMRFKWGNMEFATPSRFLREIDSRYVECDDDLSERPQCRRASQEEGFTGRMGNFNRGTQGGRKDGGSAIDALRRQFDYRFQQKREAEQKQGIKRQPDPKLVAPTIKPRSTEGMRRVNTSAPAGAPLGACAYAVGERVEHPTFGAGEVIRIEALATDHKIVVNFATGEKTPLAKFAKLKKI